MIARARHLVGRKIVRVIVHRRGEPGRGWIHDPDIHLDNGRILRFSVEGDESDYGVEMILTDKVRPVERNAGSK